jgi:hypothetical protein
MFVTIAKRPLWQRDVPEHRCDLPDSATGICTTGSLKMAAMQGRSRPELGQAH